MKNFRTILITTFLLLFVIPARAEYYEGATGCDDALPQIPKNICTTDQFKKSDAVLNRLYKEKIAAMTNSINIDRLRDSQRAWVTFRDKACLYDAGKPEESGSVWSLEHYGCMAYHTKKRIEDLKRYLNCTSDDCPN